VLRRRLYLILTGVTERGLAATVAVTTRAGEWFIFRVGERLTTWGFTDLQLVLKPPIGDGDVVVVGLPCETVGSAFVTVRVGDKVLPEF
jgi:hypothetical protein